MQILLYLNRGSMYEFVKSLLSKEVLDITDVNSLRDLREFFDERVQEEKQKQENANRNFKTKIGLK